MPPPGLKVLISGAGIAGLTLAVLLERAGIDYEVYERAATVRPLGSVLALGPSVLAMIEQIGLLERLKELSKENDVVSNYTEELELTSTIDYTVLPERAGYPNYVIARTALYDLLYSQIPKGKVHMQKRVESIQQGEGEDDLVTITFTDKTTAQGHILVGADGAYSGVRKSLFEQLHQQGKLPLSDNEEMPCTSLCLVGQTRPLSTEKFPHLNDKYCEFENITGTNKPFTWITFTLPDNTISWMVIEHLNLESEQETYARNAEWGPEAADAMIERVKPFPIPSGAKGLTMADLIDETPREQISQVALEGKFFQTWHSGRTVLIGDACHKMYPTAGQGANVAMQDAIVLANYIYSISDTKPATLTKAFQGYHEERVDSAREAYETSDRMRRLFRKRHISWLIRLLFRYIPQFVWNHIFDKVYSNRPQAAFLPLVPDRGLIKAFPQRSLDLKDTSST